jgi:hypothetical protein
VQHVMSRVSPEYAAAKAADCDTAPPTPAQVAASTNTAAKFLASLPCDVNGNPLPLAGAGQAPERTSGNR